MAEDLRELVAADDAATQQHWNWSSDIEDRRLEADIGGTAVEDQVDPAVHVRDDMGGRRRARSAGAVGRRCRERQAGGPQQGQGDRMAGDPHGDGVEAGGRDVGDNPGAAVQHQGQRSRPQRGGQALGRGRKLAAQRLGSRELGYMYDQRIVGGTALCREDPGDCCGMQGRSAEAVDSFRRKRDHTVSAEDLRSEVDSRRVGAAEHGGLAGGRHTLNRTWPAR